MVKAPSEWKKISQEELPGSSPQAAAQLCKAKPSQEITHFLAAWWWRTPWGKVNTGTSSLASADRRPFSRAQAAFRGCSNAGNQGLITSNLPSAPPPSNSRLCRHARQVLSPLFCKAWHLTYPYDAFCLMKKAHIHWSVCCACSYCHLTGVKRKSWEGLTCLINRQRSGITWFWIIFLFGPSLLLSWEKERKGTSLFLPCGRHIPCINPPS